MLLKRGKYFTVLCRFLQMTPLLCPQLPLNSVMTLIYCKITRHHHLGSLVLPSRFWPSLNLLSHNTHLSTSWRNHPSSILFACPNQSNYLLCTPSNTSQSISFKLYLGPVMERWNEKCQSMGVVVGEDTVFILSFGDNQVVVADEDDLSYLVLKEQFDVAGLRMNIGKCEYLAVEWNFIIVWRSYNRSGKSKVSWGMV